MALLKREDLLKPDELQMEIVYLDDQDYVYVREMRAADKDRFEQSLAKQVETEDGTVDFQSSPEHYRAKLLVNTVCDESGNLILYYDDVEKLSESKGAQKIEKLVNTASRLNAVSAKDRSQMTKNSGADMTAGSSSDSAKS